MDNKGNIQDYHSENAHNHQKVNNAADLETSTSYLTSTHLSKEAMSLADQLNPTNSLTSRSSFQVELHAVSQAEQQLSTLWFTTTPVRNHASFHGLGSLPCHNDSRDSSANLVQVCMPLNNYPLQPDALLNCSTLHETTSVESCTLTDRKLEEELSQQQLALAKDNCTNGIESTSTIYSIAPSQMSSGGSNVTSSAVKLATSSCGAGHLQDVPSSLQEAAHCALETANASHVSLIDLDNNNQVELQNMQQSHLQAEIVFRDSNGKISLSTGTVQIPIIRTNEDEAKEKSYQSSQNDPNMASCANEKYQIPQLMSASAENNEEERKLDGFVETVECFKCKLCPFISLSKKGVEQHVQSDHAQMCRSSDNSDLDGVNDDDDNDDDNGSESSEYEVSECEVDSRQDLQQDCSIIIKEVDSNLKGDNRYICGNCSKAFVDMESCNSHMMIDHGLKYDSIKLEDKTEKKEKKNRRTRKHNEKVDDLHCDRLLNTRRKQKVPRKMHSLDDDVGNEETNCANKKKKLRLRSVSTSAKDESVVTDEAVDSTQLASKITGPLKKRGRPKGSKNTGITALRRKNPKLKVEDELGYRCEIDDCAIRMKSIDNLDYHRRCHIRSVAGFTCPECHERFDHWRNISVHLWRVHVIDMELYACDQCSYKTYSFSKLVNMHKRIHSEERPFLCDNCGKGFKTSKQLRNHKVIHMDKRRQRSFRSGECDVCHRFFSDKRMLRVHKDTVHNKLRPFLCNYCGYAASCRSTLKMHMRQHTGEKPFSCSFCAYRTADHNSLRRHKMRHSGEKPYKCPFCPYACIQSSTYKTHLKNKHPGQDEGLMYSCNLCAFRTIKKENYITHMADHKAGTIPVNSDHTTVLVESGEKNGGEVDDNQHALLVQTAHAIPTLTQLDRLPSNLTTTQVMFSTIEDIRNKIAIAAQGFPLEISQTDRYPILVGQLKTSQIDNATVVHIDPNIQLDPGQQQFLVHEHIEATEQQIIDANLHSEAAPELH